MGMSGIGEYLRARRELVRPEDVGISVSGRRRVPGLRRSELALLAGISTEYYVRLEQGRNLHPSPQVLDALARALQLDDEATAHLHELASQAPRARRAPRRPERVPLSIRYLLDSWPATPAYVQGRRMDVLAANAMATALSPMYTPGVNLVRAAILDPAVREMCEHWDVQAAVAELRALAGPDVLDPQLNELVGELSVRSELFRSLWSRHDVVLSPAGSVRKLHHPQVGPLELYDDRLRIAGAEGLTLVVYHAEPGSPSEQSLALLASLAATERPDETGPGAAAAKVVQFPFDERG
jgi:transcriptional regulator with XRE-family HTH domain